MGERCVHEDSSKGARLIFYIGVGRNQSGSSNENGTHTNRRAFGKAVGNALEVEESIQCLKGGGLQTFINWYVIWLVIQGHPLSCLLGQHILSLNRWFVHKEETLAMPLLGGGLGICFCVNKSGIVTECNAYNVGMSVVCLGGGRVRAQDSIDPGVGVWVEKKLERL